MLNMNIFKTNHTSQHILNSAIKNKYCELQITFSDDNKKI